MSAHPATRLEKPVPSKSSSRHDRYTPPSDPLRPLQRTAGNKAVAGLVELGLDSHCALQRAEDRGVGVKLAMVPVEFAIPLPGTTLECGIKLEPKIVLKGEFAAVPGKGQDLKFSGSAGGLKFKGASPDSVSIFKAEAQAKAGQAGGKVKGSLDATPAGVNPAVEFSGPLGVAGLDVRLEFAPWKFKYDLAGKESVKLLPVTAGVKREGEFKTENFSFKGSIGVDCEASLDPEVAFKYLAERYGTAVEVDALALGAVEAALVGSVVAGAVLAGLDYIDQDRRARLIVMVTGRAQAIVRGESTYLAALERRKVTASSAEEKRALNEATRVRSALAGKASMDDETLACVTAPQEAIFVPFRWRDAELDELERNVHAGLDRWAADHPVLSLWGLRVDEDKKNVTRRIDGIREDPERYKLSSGWF